MRDEPGFSKDQAIPLSTHQLKCSMVNRVRSSAVLQMSFCRSSSHGTPAGYCLVLSTGNTTVEYVLHGGAACKYLIFLSLLHACNNLTVFLLKVQPLDLSIKRICKPRHPNSLLKLPEPLKSSTPNLVPSPTICKGSSGSTEGDAHS